MITESSNTARMLSPEYESLLREHFDTSTVDTLVYGWQQAELPDQPGETLPYVRLNEGAGTKPVLYVPGFTEGIPAKAPFAAELVHLGHDVILPDQNRKKILIDGTTNRKSATYSQAVNYLAVLEAEGIENVDVVTHSYGSLIFEAMAKIAEAKGKDYFHGANVIMLAPAGFSKENAAKLGGRLLKSMASEGKKNPKEFDSSDMLKAGVKNFSANIPRTLQESKDLRKKQLDYHGLLSGAIGSLSILSYAADRLYPDKAISREVTKAVEAGAVWAVPILQKERFDPTTSKPHATHNDEQFNPYRTAAAVDQLLRSR